MKKPFILFLGIGWAGTTSLYYTLKNKVKYMHSGFAKEPYALSKIFFKDKVFGDRYKPEESRCEKDVSIFESVDQFNVFNYNRLQYALKYHTLLNGDPILKKFTEREINSFFGFNLTLEKYINHYVRLAEYCGEEYQSVGDFSNPNFLLDKNELTQIHSALSEYFDVKALLILRDPIRRHWSRTAACSNDIRFPNRFGGNPNVEENFWKGERLFTRYTEKITNSYEIFGKKNVHYVIMEDFFKDEKNNPEVSKLEQFLNVSIPEVHPCVYVPDKGINPPKLEGLRDQWLSDTSILTPEFYENARNDPFFVKIYSEFEQFHGSLPADWGRPIDYGY